MLLIHPDTVQNCNSWRFSIRKMVSRKEIYIPSSDTDNIVPIPRSVYTEKLGARLRELLKKSLDC